MEIKTENNSARIIPGEKIDLTNSEKLQEEGKNLVEKDINNIIFDFKKVKEIDSSGIGKILVLHKMTRENQGKLVIENVNSDYVKNVFKMLDLGEVVEIRD
ncbi:MAG: STAS domain-containing protein [bacterium]